MANDPDLQLLNLAANAIYKFEGSIVYTAGTGTDMKFTFATTSATGLYCCPHINTSGNFGPFGQALGDVTHCQGQTVTQPAAAPIEGTIDTGNAPCSVILQWAQDTSGGAFTIIKAGSFLRAERIQ